MSYVAMATSDLKEKRGATSLGAIWEKLLPFCFGNGGQSKEISRYGQNRITVFSLPFARGRQ